MPKLKGINIAPLILRRYHFHTWILFSY